MSADAKPVSATRLVMAQEMTPQDANPAGNVHGGNIMKLADSAAGQERGGDAAGDRPAAAEEKVEAFGFL